MKTKKKILEKALEKEKDPKVRTEIQNRIKEADCCGTTKVSVISRNNT